MTTRICSGGAELYDIAFGWDVSAEADWLVERLGPSCRTVLEPGCGTGRLLAALAERGLEVTGIDVSEPMAAYARSRVPAAEVVVADMADLVQQGIALDPEEAWRSEWEAERDGVKLKVLWEAFGKDRSRSRIEILAGPLADDVVEDVHRSTAWTAGAWREAVDASPFVQAACYDGNLPERPRVEVEQGGGLLLHELVAP